MRYMPYKFINVLVGTLKTTREIWACKKGYEIRLKEVQWNGSDWPRIGTNGIFSWRL